MRIFLATFALLLLIFTALVRDSELSRAQAGANPCDAAGGVATTITLVDKLQGLVTGVKDKEGLQKTLEPALQKSAVLVATCVDSTKSDMDAKAPLDQYNQQLQAWKTCADSYRQECLKDDLAKTRGYRVQVRSAYYGLIESGRLAEGSKPQIVFKPRAGYVCDARAEVEKVCNQDRSNEPDGVTVNKRSCSIDVSPSLCPGGRDPTGQNEPTGPRERPSVLLVEYCCGPACKTSGTGATTIPLGKGSAKVILCNPSDYVVSTCVAATEKCGAMPVLK